MRTLFKFTLPDAVGVSVASLGDPSTVRDYAACVYHTVGGSPTLVAMEPAWAATDCNGRPCWTVKPTGVRYRNRHASRGKLGQIKIRVRGSGKSNTTVKGRATTAEVPPVPSLQLPVVVQLLAGDDLCLGATFTTATAQTVELLKAKGGQ